VEIKIMSSTEIQFTIQCLDGDTFRISIARTDAENVFCGELNLYNQYGLDVLKDAISVHNGTDPVIQQLICEDQDSELTISDSLIPLENKVITLMIKPSFLIEFSLHRPCDNHPTLPWGTNDYHLVANIKYLADPSNASEPIICYLESEKLPRIEAIGQYRDFFKIRIKNLPHNAIRYWYKQLPASENSFLCIDRSAVSTVWLRYDNRSMKIV
jgi:hypothetical protein